MKEVIFFGGRYYTKNLIGNIRRKNCFLVCNYKGDTIILDEYRSLYFAKEGEKYLRKRLQ